MNEKKVVGINPNKIYNSNVKSQNGNSSNTIEKQLPLEDLCISMDLIIEVISSRTGETEEYSATFITNKSKQSSLQGSTFKHVNNNKNQITNSLTDFYTHISYENNETGKLIEGLGITDVKIDFNSWYVPIITVNFIDIRGTSLFAVNEIQSTGSNISNKYQNVYKSFFTFPYPLFKLRVKGLLGRPVTYTLHMTDWKGEFDSTDGNFLITASFVGYTYAMLSDIQLQYLKVAPLITQPDGSKTYGETVDKKYYINDAPPKSIYDIQRSLKNIDEEVNKYVEKFKTKSKTNNEKTDNILNVSSLLNTLFEKLSSIYNGNYVMANNGSTINNDIIIIADKKIGQTELKTLNDIKSKIVEYLDKIYGKGKYDFNVNGTRIPIYTPGNISNNYESEYNPKLYNKPYNLTTEQVKSLTNGIKNPYKENNDQAQIYYNGYTTNELVIYDKSNIMTNLRMDYQYNIDNIVKKTNEAQEEINAIISNPNTGLGFKPSIGNILKVIFASMDAFIRSILDTEKIVNENLNNRRIANNSNLRTDSKSTDKVYPFPTIWKNNGKNEEIYIGHAMPSSPESTLIDKYIDEIIKQGAKDINTSNQNTNGSEINMDNTFYPFNGSCILKINNIENYSFKNLGSVDTSLVKENFFTNFANILLQALRNVNKCEYDTKLTNIIDAKIFAKTISKLIAFDFFKIARYNDSLKDIIINSFNDSTEFSKEALKYFNSADNESTISFIDYENNTLSVQVNEKGRNLVINKKSTMPLDVYPIKSTYNGNVVEIYGDSENNTPIIITNDFESIKIEIDLLKNKFTTYNFDNIEKEYITDALNFMYSTDVSESMGNSNLKSNINILNSDKDTHMYVSNDYDLYSALTNNSDQYQSFYIKNIKSYAFKDYGYTTSNIFSVSDYYKLNEISDKKERIGKKIIAFLMGVGFSRDRLSIEYIGVKNAILVPRIYLYFLGGCAKYDSYFFNSEKNFQSIGTILNDKVKEILIDIWDNFVEDCIESDTNENIILSNNDVYLYKFIKSHEFYSKKGEVLTYKDAFNLFQKLNFDYQKSDIYKYLSVNGGEDIYEKSYANEGNTFMSMTYKDDYDLTKIFLEKSFIILNDSMANVYDKLHNRPFACDMSLYTIFSTNFYDYAKRLINNDEEKSINNIILSSKYKNENSLIMYKYFKNVYDKWILGNNIENISDIFDSILILDKGFNNIEDDFLVNPTKAFLNYYDSEEASLYELITSIFSDNYFNFIPLPNFINYKDKGDLIKVFTPVPWEEAIFSNSSTPAFICMYVGELSHNLDINDLMMENDGFSLIDDNGDLTIEGKGAIGPEGNNDYLINVFSIDYGEQYQSIFKNIRVNMNNPISTEQVISTLYDISQMGGGGKRYVFAGQDLYNIYSRYSYQCEVEMLGCAEIQPTMYFQINNIPMWKGTYMIIKVTHEITPGNMITKFTGVRLNKINVPLRKEIFITTSDLLSGINPDIITDVMLQTNNPKVPSLTNPINRRDSNTLTTSTFGRSKELPSIKDWVPYQQSMKEISPNKWIDKTDENEINRLWDQFDLNLIYSVDEIVRLLKNNDFTDFYINNYKNKTNPVNSNLNNCGIRLFDTYKGNFKTQEDKESYFLRTSHAHGYAVDLHFCKNGSYGDETILEAINLLIDKYEYKSDITIEYLADTMNFNTKTGHMEITNPSQGGITWLHVSTGMDKEKATYRIKGGKINFIRGWK